MGLTHLLSFSSVMRSVGGVVLAVVILLAMVTIHEFGHYVAGKLLRFKIDEFSVGFGPALFKKRSKKTGELFALRLIPLGGYCAFDGEDGTEEEAEKAGEAEAKKRVSEVFPDAAPAETSSETTSENGAAPSSQTEKAENPTQEGVVSTGKKFTEQPPWKRIVVLVAGATMNYLLALVIIILMFTCMGRPRSYIMPVSGTEVAAAGTDALQADDVVLSVNGRDLYLITDYVDALRGVRKGDIVSAEVLRLTEERRREKITLSIEAKADGNFANMSDTGVIYALLGVDPESCEIGFAYMEQGFWDSLGDSFVYSWKLGGTILRSLGELLTGKLGLNSMGGPVTTIRVTAEAASSNLYSFLNIAGFIGVNLAVFNLLPIPALDGSKVVFCIIEWIRKKPVNRNVEAMIHFIGIIFLFGFAILVDLLQLF